MRRMKKVLVMAGGTGGHVFPGLAVARKMLDYGIEVHWLGTQKGLESRLVPEANIPIHYITISGLRGKGVKEMLFAPFRLITAIKQAIKIIRKINPDVTLGMGGFVSGPGGIASWLLKKPLVIHEQNAKAGMTNQWLAKVARKVLEAFPHTFKPSQKVITVGNPVRPEIANVFPPEKRFENRKNPLRLLVLGGSLGAVAINELVPKVLKEIEPNERPIVVHQAGEKHFDQTVTAYQTMGVEAEVVPFIKDMAAAYSTADLVLCRSGALTVTELCAAGVGAILVPYPYAVDDHQTTNGNFMVDHGAAILIQQKDLSIEKLTSLLQDFKEHREKCLKMAVAAYELRQVDAVTRVLTICEEVL